MPKIGVPKGTLEGLLPVPPGVYEVQLVGFKPRFSKDKNSYNLNPKLKIVNTNGQVFRCGPDCESKHGPAGHKTEGASPAWVNLNSGAGFIMQAFCHMFGLEMVEDEDGDANIPGDFAGDPTNPETWAYSGPLMNATGKLEVWETDNTKGGTKNTVKQFICRVPGCQEKHPTELK